MSTWVGAIGALGDDRLRAVDVRRRERAARDRPIRNFVGCDTAVDWSPPVNSRGSQLACSASDGFSQQREASSPGEEAGSQPCSLAELIAEACRRFEIDRAATDFAGTRSRI